MKAATERGGGGDNLNKYRTIALQQTHQTFVLEKQEQRKVRKTFVCIRIGLQRNDYPKLIYHDYHLCHCEIIIVI